MNEDLEIILDLAKDSMSNAISHLEKKLLNIRAGKANPNMLTNVFVDYYGTSTPISQTANINTPDGRTLIIQPWVSCSCAKNYNPFFIQMSYSFSLSLPEFLSSRPS